MVKSMSRLILILALMFSIRGFGQISDVPLFDKLLYISNNDTLPYRFLKPVNPQSKKTFPLVIFLHGAGERGRDNEVQIKHITETFLDPDNRSRHACYLLAPQCPKKVSWAVHERNGNTIMKDKPTPVMQLLIELIGQIQKEFPIDSSRIYVVGLSMGGYGTWDLISRLPNRFAAAVPICGGGDPRMVERIKNMPVWAFHGARDKVVSPVQSRVMIESLILAGGTPGYTEYPDVEHDSWVYALREPHLLPWMFDQALHKGANGK
jgi:predicted peptidase